MYTEHSRQEAILRNKTYHDIISEHYFDLHVFIRCLEGVLQY